MQSRSAVKKTRVLLVDDHPFVRQGVAQILHNEPDFEVCAEADSARKAMTALDESEPDAGIVDITLKGTNGIELIKNIVAQRPDFPILVLSMHDEKLYAERAVRAGARGYVTKQEAPDKLTLALRRILQGHIYLSEEMTAEMMHRAIGGKTSSPESPVAVLSDRELEILQLLGNGRSTSQIAQELTLSVKTVESHRAHIKEKLNLKNAPETMRFAMQWVNEGAM